MKYGISSSVLLLMIAVAGCTKHHADANAASASPIAQEATPYTRHEAEVDLLRFVFVVFPFGKLVLGLAELDVPPLIVVTEERLGNPHV